MRRRYYFLIFALVPFVLISRVPAFTEQTQMISHTVLKPFLTAGSSVSSSISDFTNYFGLFWRTFEEQKRNKQLIAALESRLSNLEEVTRENERLRKLLDFRQELARETLAARVIGWDVSPWRRTIILDKGSAHGIKKDMAVVVPDGVAGRVLETGVSTSRAILLVDPDARMSAVTSESRAQGVIAGDGSGELWLRYLGMESGVQVGESVISSAATGIFPKGLRVGKIQSIEKDSDGLHLAARVVPFAQMTKLEEVLCIGSSPTK